MNSSKGPASTSPVLTGTKPVVYAMDGTRCPVEVSPVNSSWMSSSLHVPVPGFETTVVLRRRLTQFRPLQRHVNRGGSVE